MNLLNFLLQNYSEIIQYTIEHLVLAGTAVGIGTLIGVPLGLLGTRKAKLGRVIISFANILQTIPSLALFGFLIPIPIIGGVGSRTAIVALTLYTLLPIIKNTYTGVKSVDPAVTEAGRGMGMTDRQILFQVEIPLAMGFIMAGIRVAAVISVGIATIAAAIGAGGLGVFIFRGVSMVNNEMILAGAIPAALIALLADFFLARIEKRITRRIGDSRRMNEV
jgi:osmoprotectant transport system permease protein